MSYRSRPARTGPAPSRLEAISTAGGMERCPRARRPSSVLLPTGVSMVSQGGNGCAVTTSGSVVCDLNGAGHRPRARDRHRDGHRGRRSRSARSRRRAPFSVGAGTTRASSATEAPSTSTPSRFEVSGLSSGVTSLDAGSDHTCAVTAAGGAVCWGSDRFGQLGDGPENDGSHSAVPVAVAGLASGVTGVSAGVFHSCARLASGEVRCWGDDGYGQLGSGDVGQGTDDAPIAVVGLDLPVTQVSAGNYHTCAMTIGGAIRCWGSDDAGQLGDGSKPHSAVPVDVADLSGIVKVFAESNGACAVDAGGNAWCWGEYPPGQARWTVSGVPLPPGVVSSGIAAISNGCAVTTGGALFCWDWDPSPPGDRDRRAGSAQWRQRGLRTLHTLDDGCRELLRRIGGVRALHALPCDRPRERRDEARDGLVPQLCRQARRRLVLGRERRWSARRRNHDGPDATPRRLGTCNRRGGDRRRLGAYLRAHDPRRGALLGREQSGPARRRHHHPAHAARSGLGTLERRGGDLRKYEPHLRAPGRRQRAVLGRQLGRSARRRILHGSPHSGGRDGPRSGCGVDRDGVRAYVRRSATGSVHCWGNNSLGQLGDGSVVRSGVPLPVVGFEAAPAQVPALGPPGLLLLTVSLLGIGWAFLMPRRAHRR